MGEDIGEDIYVCGREPGVSQGRETNRSAGWFLALSLEERLAGSHPEPEVDEVLALRRLEKWRRQPAFEDDILWQRRLASSGLTEDRLRRLLGESPESLGKRCREPAWLLEIEGAYAEFAGKVFEWPECVDRNESVFLPFAEPLVWAAYERLVQAAREQSARFPEAPFSPEQAAQSLCGHLPKFLGPMLNRTLVVELNVARLEERLAGDSSDERFRYFVDSLRRGEVALDILSRYPVLARRLVSRIGQWEEAGAEFLGRLAVQAGEIRRHFCPGRELGRLVEAQGAVSDPHRNGRGVLLLRFDSGFRLVYKPKPMAIEKAFQRLLEWINTQGLEAPFRTIEVLDAGDHGWMEFVEAAPCASAEEVRRFYLRQGGYLALLFLLDGTDFHNENLIAAGEHPVLVDLETLFQPSVTGRDLNHDERQPGAPLRETVLRCGLLPEREWGDRENAGVDLSGLASQEGQMTPQPVLATADRGTDRMRVERRRLEIPVGQNRPRLGDAEISLLDHAGELRKGFRKLAGLVLARRQDFLAHDGPLAAFDGTEIRILLRPTASYGMLLLESYHPHVLGDALAQQRLHDRLWGGVAERPFLVEVIPTELEEIARGDIPLFTSRPESRDVVTSSGKSLEGLLGESGFERVRRRLANLTPLKIHRQELLIHDSLEVLRLSSTPCERPAYDFRESPEPARAEELLEAARKVGERIVERALRGPDEAHWVTIDHREPAGWTCVSAGPDVYLGLPGIAFFLAYLGDLTGEDDFTEVAALALRTQRNQVKEKPEWLEGIGAYSGWGGLLYVLTHLAVLWNDERLLDEAFTYAEGLPSRVAKDELLDVIGGSAGCLAALLLLNEYHPSELLRATARACGERLLAKAVQQETGMGWIIPLAGSKALAGMSHGAAGIALALLRLWAATGDDRFRRSALAGLAFERSLFSPEVRNWPDLRARAAGEAGIDPDAELMMCAWCHGAPGIGLARVAGLGYLDDDTVRDEVAAALSTTLEQGFGQNHSLCHGDLGNLDFVLEAARALGDDELLTRAYRMAAGILRSVEEEGWLFGLPGNAETPGLMVGLSGIGYSFARLAAPDRLPSILSLAPPPVRSQRESSAIGGET